MNHKLLLSLITLIAINFCSYSQNFYENRVDIPTKYTWDFNELFTDWNQWKAFYNDTEKLVNKIASKDTFTTAADLYETLYAIDTIGNRTRKLSMYAMMNSDINQKDEFASNQQNKAMILDFKLNNKISWLSPVMQKLNSDSVFQWINDYPKLKDYEFSYRKELRDKPHVISEDKENTISCFDYSYFAFQDAYDALTNLDNDLPQITVSDSIVLLTTTKYFDILRNEHNREIRAKTYIENGKKYINNKHTISNLMNGAAYMDFAYAQAYHYDNTLAYTIDYDSIPLALYSNLIEQVKKESKPLKRYHKLRAEALKLKDYAPYDSRFSIAAPKLDYGIEMAKDLILKALKPMGNEYINKTLQLLNNRKIDYFENRGKITSVAYSTDCYGFSPYILTSYGNSLKDMYDLIHELGHSVHGMYAMENQPSSIYESTIFIDEITSTFNELLLSDYLLNHWESTESRLYLLEIAINNMEYYYRSALKADFVLQLYNNIEADEDVTASLLDNIYGKIYIEFYGNSIHNFDSSSWCFYGMPDFYDYQYVTSMTASINIFDNIKNDTSELWKSKYFTLLKAGGNDFPINQLNTAGINIMDKSIYSSLSNYMNTLIDLYEQELKKNKLIE